MVPPIAVRLRRDFGAILNLIRAHAVLHQASRERDEQGRIIATLKDYVTVRELVAELVSEGIEATMPKTIRETVEAVSLLNEGFDKAVTVAKLAEKLELDKSAVWRRVRTAIDRGYLKNLEDRKGRQARLVPGEPLPEDVEILPSVEGLQGRSESRGGPDNCFSPDAMETIKEHTEGEDDDSEQLDRGEIEDTVIAGSATAGVEKKDSLDPPENGCNPATPYSLTVDGALKGNTRYGSKASYVYERYIDEPDSRMLGQLVRAVLAGTGMDITHWREHAPTVEQAAEHLEAEDRAEDERYDQMVKQRIASLEADFEEEARNQQEAREQEKCLKVAYVGTGYRNGVTGKAYPRGEKQYWFQPDTGAIGVRVKAEDLELVDTETSEA